MQQPITRRTFVAALAAPLLAESPMASDPDRPRFHFLPPSMWMNDPNGPIWHQGQYHLYYQHNPKAAQWDTMHWGHAVSTDLLHWRHLAISLAPTPGGPDKDGCFSGCMVINQGTPTLVYTGVNPEVQCIATSNDLQNWTKHPRNPVLSAAPKELNSPGFRDPHVWREGGQWLMVIGAGERGVGGTALLYESADLLDWKYQGRLHSGKMVAGKQDPVGSGEMWECPDFFPVGNKWLLYVSTQGKVLYWLGSWKNRVFKPESEGVLVHGSGYAPKSCQASGKRRIIWTWLREQRRKEDQLKAGWSGAMSLAVVPTLGKDGGLRLAPAAEYTKLRGKRVKEAIEDCCEIHLTLSGTEPFLLARGGRELIGFDPDTHVMTAGHSEADVGPGALDLRIFLDGSVVEVFANSRVWLTGRVYGPIEGIRMSGRPLKIESWPLKPVSPDRLTSV